jgi:hypothetical protein
VRTIRTWVRGIVLSVFLSAELILASPGDVDTSFNAETGVNGWVDVVTPLPEGKILVGGGFTSVQGALRPGLARLNTDGSLDNTFVPALSNSPTVFCAAVQSMGRLS